MRLPDLKGARWHERPSTLALVAGIGSVGGAATKVLPDYLQHRLDSITALGGVLGLLAFAGTLLSFQQARRKESQAGAASRDLAGLNGALCALRRVLLLRQVGDAEALRKMLRLTVHRYDGESLEQLVDYVGGDGGGVGRSHSNKSGVVGTCVRTGKFAVEVRRAKDSEAHVEELVRDHHFTEKEARSLTQDRWAWAAYPLSDGAGKVTGVLFLDSNNPKFFSDHCRKVISEGCEGLADYLRLSASRERA